MLYHTMKDHLARHVDPLTAQPTSSLWDYVPEPRLQIAQPLINDARSGVGTTNNEFATQACFVCNTFGPCACTQSDEAELADSMNEAPSSPKKKLRCLGCGQFMHRDDIYPCMDCFKSPFHAGCLEDHYERAHPRPQQAHEDDKKVKEEEILQREADDACSQWVDQMTNLSNIAMPLSRRIASFVVIFVSVALAVEPFWATITADEPVSLLQ